MKKVLKRILFFLAQHDITWFLLKPVVSFGGALGYTRRMVKNKPKDFSYLFKDNTVLNGPFKGMIYPSITSVGSQVYPKLIGSYEQELHETIEYFCSRSYSEIIDVGCAEGYYAIGLAKRIEKANVYAYDIDQTARMLCGQMAKLNQVEKRVHIREFCSADELKNFNVTDKGLIICDCEGYEKQLFTAGNIHSLKKFDLLIEVHDFRDITISPYLHQLFSPSHTIKVVRSIDDIEKVRTYKFLNEPLSLPDKLQLYEERRPGIMEWMLCLSK